MPCVLIELYVSFNSKFTTLINEKRLIFTTMEANDFNFYREAKNNYKHIVPVKEEGRILFSLYEKIEQGFFEHNEFSEQEIIKAIEQVYSDVRGDTAKRNEYERNNDIILRLQEFFLWRDEKKKMYSFKSYGIDFCKNIKEQLFQYYSPTEIKSIFDSLINELKSSLNTENGFILWMKLHFNIRSTELSRQVEILDQQVSDAVKTFRSRIKSESKEAIYIINDALESLDTIKRNSDEFRSAFQGTYEIEELILLLQENHLVSEDEINKIRVVRDFIRRIRSHLELVSKRIDQIQPRIREFIHDFNQKDFDRKTELFIQYLLKNVSVGKDDNKKSLFYPTLILPIPYKESTAIFPIIIKKDIGIVRAIDIPVRDMNIEKRNVSLSAAKSKQLIRERVTYWLANLQDVLDKENCIYFTQYFYKILSAESTHQLTIAVRVTYKAVIKYTRHQAYDVEINNKLIGSDDYENISLWKIFIKKREMTNLVS